MSESDKTPIVFFYENIDEIIDMLDRRFFKKNIWEHLVRKGKYRGHYSHFVRLVKTEIHDKEISQDNVVYVNFGGG